MTFAIALLVAGILVLCTAGYWGLLSNTRSPSVGFAIAIVAIPVMGIVVLLEISYLLTVSASQMFSDPQFAAHPLAFIMQSRVIKRAGIALAALFGSLYLVISICEVMTKEERVGKCELNGIEQIVFFATSWQQDTKAASICAWQR